MVNQTYGKYGNPSPSDMTYNFYSLQNPNNPVQATINSVSNVKNSHFTPSKDTVIIIHGYWENGTTDMPTKVKGAIIDGKCLVLKYLLLSIFCFLVFAWNVSVFIVFFLLFIYLPFRIPPILITVNYFVEN